MPLTSISNGTVACVVVESINTLATMLARVRVALIYLILTLSASVASLTLACIANNTTVSK